MSAHNCGSKSKMHLGEGSEWHLMRFLGRHRQYINRGIEKAIPDSEVVDWLDFRFNSSDALLDAELEGLAFLDERAVLAAWAGFWPQSGRSQNWDAIGKVRIGDTVHWLLVEAKAHVGEPDSECGATSPGSKSMIEAAFAETKAALGVTSSGDWCKPYYQYANRLALLHFLTTHGVPARLLFVYFVGDRLPGRDCPKTKEKWTPTLKAIHDHLGLTGRSDLEQLIHSVFIPVDGVER